MPYKLLKILLVLLASIGVVLAVLAALSKGASMKDLPVITDGSHIERFDAQQVRVQGEYTQISVNQRPGASTKFRGNVAVVLADGTELLLYPIWSQEAKRPKEEIARYEHKQVIVTGILYAEAPESGDGAANLLMPCISEIRSIELAQEASHSPEG